MRRGRDSASPPRHQPVQASTSTASGTRGTRKRFAPTPQTAPIDAARVLLQLAPAQIVDLHAFLEGYDDLAVLRHEDVEHDLTLAGIQAMIDPPREEAVDAVKGCRRAGIRVVMITGDHPTTALAIAKMVGIDTTGDRVVTGREIEEMKDEDLFYRVKTVSVYARVAPHHKLRIVRQLMDHGEVVAVTGDGVNDAPALRAAHLGVVAPGVADGDAVAIAAHAGSGHVVAAQAPPFFVVANAAIRKVKEGRYIRLRDLLTLDTKRDADREKLGALANTSVQPSILAPSSPLTYVAAPATSSVTDTLPTGEPSLPIAPRSRCRYALTPTA